MSMGLFITKSSNYKIIKKLSFLCNEFCENNARSHLVRCCTPTNTHWASSAEKKMALPKNTTFRFQHFIDWLALATSQLFALVFINKVNFMYIYFNWNSSRDTLHCPTRSTTFLVENWAVYKLLIL